MSHATAPLSEVCSFRHGGTPSKGNASYWGGTIPWISPKDMKASVLTASQDTITEAGVSGSAASVVPEGSILVVARSGILAHTLPVALAGRPLAFNQDIKAIQVTSEKVLGEYVYWFIRGREHEVLTRGVKKGATVHSLQSGYLEGLDIPLVPLPEQRRIVDLLSRAENIVRMRREAEQKAKEIIPALFLDMFGDPGTNPKALDKRPLKDLIKVKSGEFLPSEKMDAGGTIPVFGGNGINGYHSTAMFSAPMVVIGRVGAYCGNVHNTPPGVWVTDNALYVAERFAPLRTAYLVQALRHAKLNQVASQAGQPLISGSRIYPIEILVPPEGRQDLFATRATQAEELARHQVSATESASSVFQSLLAGVFQE